MNEQPSVTSSSSGLLYILYQLRTLGNTVFRGITDSIKRAKLSGSCTVQDVQQDGDVSQFTQKK